MKLLCLLFGHRHAREGAAIHADRHWHSHCTRCRIPLIKTYDGWIRDAAPQAPPRTAQ